MKSFDDLVLDSINVPNDVYLVSSILSTPAASISSCCFSSLDWWRRGSGSTDCFPPLVLFSISRVLLCCRASARAHRRQMLCVCVRVCIQSSAERSRVCVCVYVRVNVFVHYSWVSEFHLSSHLFNKTTKKVPTCTWMHSSPPLLCDFSWQFVSLNVWWHVHLLLLYMCITGYKGVFEHSKHVRFSLVSGWTPCLSFWVGTWAAVSNFFFVVIIRPKPSIVRDFQFFPFSLLLTYGSVLLMSNWGGSKKSLLLLLLLMKSLSLYNMIQSILFQYLLKPNRKEPISFVVFFKARSNRISISVYSFSYSLAKKKKFWRKNAIQLLRGGN